MRYLLLLALAGCEVNAPLRRECEMRYRSAKTVQDSVQVVNDNFNCRDYLKDATEKP